MAKSMTAYGRSQQIIGTKRITVELKSVNNRFFDCTVKAPAMYGFLEQKAQTYLSQQGVSRGKISVYIGIERLEDETVTMQLDRAYAGAYLAALRDLQKTFSLPDDITTMTVAQNREIFSVLREDEDTDRLWSDVQCVLSQAIADFIKMRLAEGEALCADLLQKKQFLQECVGIIAARAPQIAKEYQARLEEKLRATLDTYGVQADEARILTECAVFADKVAIDEELVRLQSHFASFDRILADNDPVGKKLDFLLQEMNREVNTIGSKASDAAIVQKVVSAKGEIEKLREQVQNVE